MIGPREGVSSYSVTLFRTGYSIIFCEKGLWNECHAGWLYRVSTIDYNSALQVDVPWATGCGKNCTENASDSHQGRPQLKASPEYLSEREKLVVGKLSRLARSLTQFVKTAADIDNRGIALNILMRINDTNTPEERLFFHMTAAFDELQRELIMEYTRAGLKAAAKRGRCGGRTKTVAEKPSSTLRPRSSTPETIHSSATSSARSKSLEQHPTDTSLQISSINSDMYMLTGLEHRQYLWDIWYLYFDRHFLVETGLSPPRTLLIIATVLNLAWDIRVGGSIPVAALAIQLANIIYWFLIWLLPHSIESIAKG